MDQIAFKDGYKYQLSAKYQVELPKFENFERKLISTEYIMLDPTGWLWVKPGYAWDGPSGPTIDSDTFMRGSLVHDALYQLMRGHHLDVETDRIIADEILREMCVEDGMFRVRAWYVYRSVRMFGKSSATAEPREIHYAPWAMP